MIPRFSARAAIFAVALIVPAAAEAQLGKLGKKLGKAVGQEIVGKPAAASDASSSAPVLTPEMLDAFLKGVAIEAQPRMAALQRHQADQAAFDRYNFQVDSLSQALTAEYQRGSAGAMQCQQSLSNDPAMMQLNMQMAQKMEGMSEADRDRMMVKLEGWGEKMRAAYQANDMKTVGMYSDSLRAALGVDVTAASMAPSAAYQQCVAQQQASSGIDTDKIDAINAQLQRLMQNPVREPSSDDLDIPQSQRDSLRALGIAASGLSASEYAWAREQSWAYLASVSRGEEGAGDAAWLEMMRARQAELKTYEFVIAES
jgi:hypothetical protein